MLQYLNIIFSDLAYIVVTFVIDIIMLSFIKKKNKNSNNLGNFVQNVNLAADLEENLRNIERNKRKK